MVSAQRMPAGVHKHQRIMISSSRPKNITIDRAAGRLNIIWADDMSSSFELRWLRANCPCATCRERRREAELATATLTLHAGPRVDPSIEIAGAELVGNYAIRLQWTDGHDTGIYGFSSLRASSDPERFPNGPGELVFE